MIKVSVIVPVYRVPLEYLRACLSSLASQTMQDSEFILVSDGAPEAECSVCDEFSAMDSRFKFFKQEHAGVSTTRNYGIEQSQGEYITFVDADDWIEPETCNVTYSLAKENHSDIVFWNSDIPEGPRTVFFCQKNIPHLNAHEKEDCLKSIIHPPQKGYNICLTVCKLISRKKINNISLRFDHSLCIGEDRVFNYSIFKSSFEISYLNKTLYHYRPNPRSIIHSYKENKFHDYWLYLCKLADLSDESYQDALANEVIDAFYGCLFSLYKSNLKATTLYNELIFLRGFIKNPLFNRYIQKANLPHYLEESYIMKLELCLMKHGIDSLFTIRIIKNFLHHLWPLSP